MLVLFVLQDSEIHVEKYLSPEEKQKQEEALKLEEEKRLAEMVGGDMQIFITYNFYVQDSCAI